MSRLDYLLIHANQRDYVAIECTFVQNGKPYLYKAEVSDNWVIGDRAIVEVDKEFKIVLVTAVHTNPLDILEPDIAYRWVGQKINLSKMRSREETQQKMIATLRQWEVQQRTMRVVEERKAWLASQPDGQKMLAAFESLGGQPVEVTL